MIHTAEIVFRPAQMVTNAVLGIDPYPREKRGKYVRLPSGLLLPFIGGGATGTSLSDFLENELLDHVVGNSAYSAPATLYFAVYTANPSDAGGGTEVTGGSYARVAKTNNLTNFPAASGGSKSNANDIDFGLATANWGTLTGAAVLDAASAGNFLFWGALTQSKVINNGDGFKFTTGNVTFALD